MQVLTKLSQSKNSGPTGLDWNQLPTICFPTIHLSTHRHEVSSPEGNTKHMGFHLIAPSVSSWIYWRSLTFVELNVRKLRLCDNQTDQKLKWVAGKTPRRKQPSFHIILSTFQSVGGEQEGILLWWMLCIYPMISIEIRKYKGIRFTAASMVASVTPLRWNIISLQQLHAYMSTETGWRYWTGNAGIFFYFYWSNSGSLRNKQKNKQT